MSYQYDGPNPNPAGTARLSCHGGNKYNSVKPLDHVAITDGAKNYRIWGDEQNEELILHFENKKLDPEATCKAYVTNAYNLMSASTKALGLPAFLRNYPKMGKEYCEGDCMRKWCSHAV